MNKKICKKVMSIILILIMFLLVFSPYSQATSSDEWMSQGSDFINKGKQNSTVDTNQIQNALMPLGRTLVTIATITLTVVTVVMGIKYMMADTGDKKAKLKTQLIGLVVSTVVIYGAQIIWTLLYNFMTKVTA